MSEPTPAALAAITLLTPDEVCSALKVTKDWLYDHVQAGEFPVVRVGRHLRFKIVDVEKWIMGHYETAA